MTAVGMTVARRRQTTEMMMFHTDRMSDSVATAARLPTTTVIRLTRAADSDKITKEVIL